MSKRNSDLIAGITSLLIAAIFWSQGLKLGTESNLLPKVLEYFIIIAGLGVLVRGFLRGKDVQGSHEEKEGLNWTRAIVIIIATIVYVICIAYIGFYVSTVLYLLLGSWYLNEKGFTLSSLVFSLVFGVGVSGILYATFTVFLQVPTPTGLLF